MSALVGVAVAVGLAVALPLVALWIAGRRLPGTHVATVSGVVPAPPDAVRARISDWRGYPAWKRDVRATEELGVVDGAVRFREHTRRPLDLDVLRDDDVVVFRVVENPMFGGTWTWTFAPEGDGTRVTATEEGHVNHAVVRAIFHHLVGEDANLRATLADLTRSFDPR